MPAAGELTQFWGTVNAHCCHFMRTQTVLDPLSVIKKMIFDKSVAMFHMPEAV